MIATHIASTTVLSKQDYQRKIHDTRIHMLFTICLHLVQYNADETLQTSTTSVEVT